MNTLDFTSLINKDEIAEKYNAMTRGMEKIYSGSSMEMTIKKR
jgi:hypothetical protein